nr:unnamed protein product [Naegleria fowleri]
MMLGTRKGLLNSYGGGVDYKRNTMSPHSPSSPSISSVVVVGGGGGVGSASHHHRPFHEMTNPNNNNNNHRRSAPIIKQSFSHANYNPYQQQIQQQQPQLPQLQQPFHHQPMNNIHSTSSSPELPQQPHQQPHQQPQQQKHYNASKTCFKQGIMIKQGAKVKNYKTRYFLLYSNRMTYHKMNKKKEYNKTPQGEISLKGLTTSNIYEMSHMDPRAQKEGLKFGFVVADQEHARNYYLFTESREESLEWIHAIHQVVNMSASFELLANSGSNLPSNSVPSSGNSPVVNSIVNPIMNSMNFTTSFTMNTTVAASNGNSSNIRNSMTPSTPTSPSYSPSHPFLSKKKSDLQQQAVLSSTSLNLSQLEQQGTPRSSQRLLQQANVDTMITSNYTLSSSLVNSPRISNTQNSPLSSSPLIISSSNSSFTGVTSVLKGSQESELTTVSTSSNSLVEFMNAVDPLPETSPRLENVEENVSVSTPISTTDTTLNPFNTSPNMQQENPSIMTDEEEFSVALNAAAIFLKDEMERTPQEQAYVVAMNYFRTQLDEHCKKHNCKPAYGLALGTVIFCIPEEQRTAAEQEYYQDVVNQFMSSVNLFSFLTTQLSSSQNEIESTPTIDFDDVSLEMEQHLVDMSCYLSYHSSQIIPIHIQVEIAKACKEICRKPPHERTFDENEFVERLCELHYMFKRLYYKNGIIPNQLTLLASILLGMDHELFGNFQVLEEMKLKSYFEQTQLSEQNLVGHFSDKDDEILQPPSNFSLYANMLDVKMYELKQSLRKSNNSQQ